MPWIFHIALLSGYFSSSAMPQGPTAACPKSDTFGGRDQKGSPRLRGINSILSINKVKTACVAKVPMIFFPTCQVRVVRFYVSLLLLHLLHLFLALLLVLLFRPSEFTVACRASTSRSCEFSVARRTSTAIMCVQCGAPDLNHDHVSSVWHAGPQPRNASERMLEDVSERMSKDMSKKIWKDMSERMPEDMPEWISEDMSERMSKDMSERMSKNMSDTMSKDISERILEDMSQRISEDMLERCIRKNIKKKLPNILKRISKHIFKKKDVRKN